MPARPSPPPPSATTRRTAIGAALAGLATLSACDAGRHETPAGPGVSTPTDPDADLVSGLTDEMHALLVLAGSVEATFPRLRPAVRPWRDLHETHLSVLDDDATAPTPRKRSFAGPEAALRQLRLREQRFQGRLVDASVSARSGALARVLACMSAGVAQQLVAHATTDQEQTG